LQKLDKAARIAGDKAHSALSLVDYNPEVAPAMSYVFGSSFICDDNSSASTVAFNRDISTHAVSVDGTAYDPSGTLSGGAAPTGSGILVKVQNLKKIEQQLKEATSELEQLQIAERQLAEKRQNWQRLERELEIKAHELTLLKERDEGSDVTRVNISAFWVHVTPADRHLFRLALEGDREPSPD